jgi:rfaE bifunctional protein kinase chain/domain
MILKNAATEDLVKMTDADADIARKIRAEYSSGEKLAFVSGNFNIVHPGHLRILKFAAESADRLIVGINPDSNAGATVNADLRIEAIRSLTMVDHAIPLDGDVSSFISTLKPDFVVKGKEHEDQFNEESELVGAYGGQVLFCSGEMRFSSLALLQREYSDADMSSIRKARGYPTRHSFRAEELKSVLSSFVDLNVVVIGDLIVDRYIDCDPLGMSQEDPTIVVSPISEETFVGGAGIVAAHARSLGANVSYITVGGHDNEAEYALDQLKQYDVDATLIVDETRPTTLKQRYRALGKTLLRVNRLRQHAASKQVIEQMSSTILDRISGADLILFSDFNYGCLPQPLVELIAAKGRENGTMMAADSQASSQMSDISRFQHMDLISPTEREARLATQDTESGLAYLAAVLRDKSMARNVVITLGAEGMLVHGMKADTYQNDRLPAFNTAPKDVAGGGDSFFTAAALALASGADIWRSSYIGALAAGCQVSTVGNRPISRQRIFEEIDLPDHLHSTE